MKVFMLLLTYLTAFKCMRFSLKKLCFPVHSELNLCDGNGTYKLCQPPFFLGQCEPLAKHPPSPRYVGIYAAGDPLVRLHFFTDSVSKPVIVCPCDPAFLSASSNLVLRNVITFIASDTWYSRTALSE